MNALNPFSVISRPHRRALWFGARLAVALMGCGLLAHANTATKPGGPAATNTSISILEIPRATFVLPHSAAEGKDPFFPKSTRPYAVPVAPVVTTTNAAPVVVVVELKLNGISGTPERRLAIINNHTFETGEDAELNTPTGKFRVRCLEIRADGVSVFVNGERRELRLRSGL